MKQEILKIIEHFSERKSVNKKTRVSVFFICFTISLFIWFLIKMSKDYTTEIKFPLSYENPPVGLTLIHAQDSTITIKLNSKGFDLLYVKMFDSKSEIKINLAESNIYSAGNKKYILTNNISNQILRQIKFADQISGIFPDSLRFQLEPIISKKVPVNVNINYTLKPTYLIYNDPVVVPDSVLISGPPSLINEITFIETESKNISNVDEKIEKEFQLIKPKNDKVEYSHKKISYTAEVEEFTEGVAEIKIQVKNTQEGRIKLFPEKAKVTYLIALKDFSNFKDDMISIGIKFDPVKERQKLEILHQPSFIRITNIEPKNVEYIIL